ncbi:MAG: hypothetical protein ACYCQJ_00650 [Nitrososphaerales archaeon]
MRSQNIFARFRSVKNNPYPLMVLLLAGLFRAVPVIIAWPYPVGYDTTASYVIQMIRPIPNLYVIFSEQALHQLILSTAYSIFRYPFILLNGFAVIVSAILSLAVFVYARKVANFDPKLSFFVSMIFTFNLLTLRLLWDQYRMDLGLIFALLTFIALSSKNKLIRALSIPFMLLAIVSNPEPTAFLLSTLLVYFVIRKPRSLKTLEFYVPITGAVIFILQLIAIKNAQNTQSIIPLYNVSLQQGLSTSGGDLLFFLYASWPLLVLIPYVLRKHGNRLRIQYHVLWLFILIATAVVLPLIGLEIASEPVNWLYWMGSFPLAIFFGEAFKVIKTRAMKKLVVALVAFLVFTSASYVVSSPLAPAPYTLLATHYAADFPVGYLQNTIPTSEDGDLVSILNSSLLTLHGNDTLYLAQQFYGFSLIQSNPNSIHVVFIGLVNNEENLTSLAISKSGGYTIWWTNPTGWYGVSSIPSDLHLVMAKGTFSLYRIE